MSSLENDYLHSPCSSSKRVQCSLSLDVDSCRVSLINLDEAEDSKWVSDSDLELKCFQDIPSPSSWSSLRGRVIDQIRGRSYEETLMILEHYDMSASSHVSNANEPLFWPFERKWDWSSWDGFCMSPRKDHKLPQVTSTASIGSKVGTRVVFRSESTTRKIVEWKERSTNKGSGRNKVKPSRLSKSAKASMKVVPLETAEFLDITKPADEKFLPEGFHIEKIVGLGEFDGHEGVDPEFSESDFMFL